MSVLAERLRRLLPGIWLGLTVSTGLIAAPTAFALLGHAASGQVVGRLLGAEAQLSLLFGAVLVVLERFAARRAAARSVPASQFSAGTLLALGALFLTVTGYHALLPMMDAARAGQGRWTFAQLHAVSLACFGLKAGLVATLAWRATRTDAAMTTGDAAERRLSPPPAASSR